jgi:hypothetical protein
MDTLAYLYPWDVVGDPDAAPLLADLGVRGAVLAAAYHATRALTPRHPRHRVVTAERTAAYFPLDPDWPAPIRPAAQSVSPGDDPFGAAVEALAGAGVPVTGWAVLLHVDGVAAESTVLNAHGDRYPWALCAARPESVEYACALAAAVAARPGLAGLELEACGWYGFGHLSAHDKTGGGALPGATDFLLSLCFCPACQRGYTAAGLDAAVLRGDVAAALDGALAGTSEPGDWPAVRELLGAEVAAAVLRFRDRAGDALRSRVLAAVRAVSGTLPVLLHADPVRHRSGANAGLDIPAALRAADGVVLNCWSPATAEHVIRAATAGRGAGRIAASLLAVRALGGHPDSLRDQLTVAAGAGATEGRLYHAGLAGAADLAAVRTALT